MLSQPGWLYQDDKGLMLSKNDQFHVQSTVTAISGWHGSDVKHDHFNAQSTVTAMSGQQESDAVKKKKKVQRSANGDSYIRVTRVRCCKTWPLQCSVNCDSCIVATRVRCCKTWPLQCSVNCDSCIGATRVWCCKTWPEFSAGNHHWPVCGQCMQEGWPHEASSFIKPTTCMGWRQTVWNPLKIMLINIPPQMNSAGFHTKKKKKKKSLISEAVTWFCYAQTTRMVISFQKKPVKIPHWCNTPWRKNLAGFNTRKSLIPQIKLILLDSIHCWFKLREKCEFYNWIHVTKLRPI